MSQTDTAHAWWSRLRHNGLLLSPVVMLERYPSAPEPASWSATSRLRDAQTRFTAKVAAEGEPSLSEAAVLAWVDALLDGYLGHKWGRLVRQNSIPDKLTAVVRIGSRSETIRPHRVLYADPNATVPALLVMADTSAQVGRGRGRTAYARFLELLRGTGHRLGLLTNGFQFRLIYAGLDFESWCEWESDRWFDDGEGSEELAGLRQLLSPESLKPLKAGVSGLLDAVEESRKRQTDLSSVLRENVRQAVEYLLEDVSAANRTNATLFNPLVQHGDGPPLTDAQAHEALYQATVRVVMRLVVCLFAESRQLLPTNDPIFGSAYGVRSLYELLEEAVRTEGGIHALFNQQTAWPRLMALFRLIHGGSAHGSFPLRAYGGALFRPGDAASSDPVARALHILEHSVSVSDSTIHAVLRKLLRGPLPVMRGRQKTFVEGPVDYTDLRTEFIGLIYEGLLDYRLKRTDAEIGPQVFLNIGREPVLPLKRLEDMLRNDRNGLKNLLTTLRKETVTGGGASGEEEESGGDEEAEEPADDQGGAEEEAVIEVEAEAPEDEGLRGGDYLDAVEASKRWAREAVVLAGLVGRQRARESDSEYQARTEAEANRLIKRVVATGEFYLVRAGNTRKGTGTFYTRPQLAVPTVHRTLEPLCYSVDGGRWTVDGGRWTVDGEEGKSDGGAGLPGTGGLAGSHEPCDTGLPGDEGIPQGGNLRADQSGAPGGRVGSVEHRRGTGTTLDSRVPAPPVDRQGVTPGSADADRDRSQVGVPDRSACRGDRSADRSGGSVAERAHQRPEPEGAARRVLIPKRPEEILALKVCDPACGSASFLVAALHYLTNALYESLKFHCHIEDPAHAPHVTLPFGLPVSAPSTVHRPPSTEYVPFPPDDPHRGHLFAEEVKARLTRHVVERCIYGVDINPLAVELARVSLWVETLNRDLPFSFLDHKVKVGNSLVGCWLDRVEDYPIRAWEREGGDGKDGLRTKRIKWHLQGGDYPSDPSTVHRPPSTPKGSGIIKREMIDVIKNGFSNVTPLFPEIKVATPQVAEQIRAEYESLHNLHVETSPEDREAYYRERVLGSPALKRLKRAMDEWCAVWFWPTDEESLAAVPTPLTFHEASGAKDAVVDAVAADLKFFHWELEFPDVFTPQRSGFDALIGNPPWDVMKPNSQEFFTEFDPLYRTYDKQAALRKQRELFQTVPGVAEQWDEYNARFKALGNWARNAAEPFDLPLARGRDGEALARTWAKRRGERVGYADPRHPFRLQGSADLNSYKMFAESFWSLLQPSGRLGVILPTGIYSDFGTKDLRETLLTQGRIDLIYAFQNEKRVFSAAHHSFKQVALLVTKGGRTEAFRARFRMGVGDSPEAHEIPDDILRNDSGAMVFTPEDVRKNSPKSLSLVELRSPRDLAIFRKIYDHSIRIGDNAPGWEITYAREFDMTNDSHLFPPLEQWEAKGYRPDVFGRWIGPEGDVALPVYQGIMFHQFECGRSWYVSGAGKKVVWENRKPDNYGFRSQFLMDSKELTDGSHCSKLVMRDVSSPTNQRTMITALIPEFPCIHKVPRLRVGFEDNRATYTLLAITNSLTFDSIVRMRFSPSGGGGSIPLNVVVELPIPSTVDLSCKATIRVLLASARLGLLHRRFAPEWLKLAHLYPEVFGFDPLADHRPQTTGHSTPSTVHRPPSTREWKHWWAVTEADRLRLRVEIDALCADLYGLDPDDFDWIVRDDPTDPKGFYRVDRQLPFRERLTGLAAAAFRALKEGKWTVDGGRIREPKPIHRPRSTVHQPPNCPTTSSSRSLAFPN